MAELAAGRSVTRRTLGVALAPAHVAARLRRAVGLPERDGLLVRGVEDGSPAARAGLVQGDLIVGVAGGAVAAVDELLDVLDRLDDGGLAGPHRRARHRGARRRRDVRPHGRGR